MPVDVDTREIMDYVSRLAEEERLRVQKSLIDLIPSEIDALDAFLGGAVGKAADVLRNRVPVVGGLLSGLLKIAVGGAVVVIALLSPAAIMNFKPVHEVIALMDQEKKEALAENVRSIMRSVDVTDVAMLTQDLSTKSKVVRAIVEFFKNQLCMPIHCRSLIA